MTFRKFVLLYALFAVLATMWVQYYAWPAIARVLAANGVKGL